MSFPAPGDLPSPCIGTCMLQDDGTCSSCRRTVAEISLWPYASAAEKHAIWQRLLALPQLKRGKICQQCGEKFSCGSDDSRCWCMDLPHQAPLEQAQGDCLCPSCLRATLQF